MLPPREEDPNPPGTPMVLMAVVATAMGASGLFFLRNDLVASVAFAMIGIGALTGFMGGAWKFVSMVAAVGSGYQLAAPAAPHLLPYLLPLVTRVLGQDRPLTPLMGLILSGVAAGAFVGLVVQILGAVVMGRVKSLKWFDRRVGMFIGCGQSAFAVAFVLWGATALEPTLKHFQARGAKAAVPGVEASWPKIIELAEATKSSAVQPLLNRWNPFRDVPQLRKLIDQAEAVANGGRSGGSFDPNSQVAQQMMQDPQMRESLNKLSSDPQVQELIRQSNGKPDMNTALQLMNHPEVAEILKRMGTRQNTSQP